MKQKITIENPEIDQSQFDEILKIIKENKDLKNLLKLYDKMGEDKEMFMHIDWLSILLADKLNKPNLEIMIDLENFIFDKYKYVVKKR